MEFWGIEVKPGEKVKVEPGVDKYLHLSQACIGESKKASANASVPVYLNFEGKKLVIGQLNAEKCAQISYDLVFEKEFELSHSWKDGSVFFTGYKTIISDEPDDFGDDSSEEEEEEMKVEPSAKVENGKPVKKENAAKPSDSASKAKGKPEDAVKPLVKEDEDDSDDDEDDESEDSDLGDSDDGSDEEMADGDDSDEDDEEDESSDEEEKVTPKKDKKRGAPDAKTPVTDNKKAKVVTPAGKTGGADGKKVPHAATPYPKQAGKTPASGDKSKQQTPKSGSFTCKPCNRSFNSDGALQSHTKAKHSS